MSNPLTDTLPSAVDPSYRELKNAQLAARLQYAKTEGPGYLTAFLGGTKIHAAVRVIRGHSGADHPRTLCQNHTPRSYASEYNPINDDREVTCKRCLASLEARS